MHYECLVHKFTFIFRFSQEILIEYNIPGTGLGERQTAMNKELLKNSYPHDLYILCFLNQIYFKKKLRSLQSTCLSIYIHFKLTLFLYFIVFGAGRTIRDEFHLKRLNFKYLWNDKMKVSSKQRF